MQEPGSPWFVGGRWDSRNDLKLIWPSTNTQRGGRNHSSLCPAKEEQVGPVSGQTDPFCCPGPAMSVTGVGQVVGAHAALCPSDGVLAATAGILEVAAHLEFDLTPTGMCGSHCWIRTCWFSLSGTNRRILIFVFKPGLVFSAGVLLCGTFACGAN